MANYERGSADDVRVFDGGDDDDDTEGSRLPLLIVIALLVLGAFGAVVYLAYQRGVAQGHSEIPRVIAALPGPAKVAPANAGGTQTPYTGLKIYQQPAPSNDQADADTGGVPPTTPAPAAIKPVPAAATPAPVAAKPVPVAATPAPSAVKPAPAAITPAPAVAKPPPVAVTKPVPAPVALKPAVIPPREVASASLPPAAVTPKPVPVVPKPAPVVTAPVKPTPAPVAAVTPAPAVVKPVPEPAAPAGGGFVQIGSFRSTAEADAAWAAYKARHSGAIGGLPNNIKAASLGAKGTWYRLRIVTASKADAVTLCTKLKTEGGDCILAK